MATGGYDSVVDSRVTCSVCLEPFKGRHPKLLPCFHTFCSPCLTQLTERQVSQTLKSPNLSEDDGKKSHKATPVSIICPTCRTPTPLPPGGVSRLQGNFYLDHDEKQAIKPQRYLCDLCEEGHEAKHTCAECLTYFCSRCQRTHDKICKKARVSGVNTKPAADGKEQPATNTHVDQVEMEKVLKKLSEQENKLGQERRAREHDIHVRYVTLMRHAGEARDESLASLRDVTQAMNDVIQTDVAMARDALGRQKQRGSDSVTGQQSSGCADGVISETNRRRFEDLLQKNEDLDLLNYQLAEIFREPLVRSIRNFMGNVDNQDLHRDSDKTKCNAQASYDASLKENTGGALSSQVEQLSEKFRHSEQLVSTLQAQNTLLCRDLASVHDRNNALLGDVTALKKEMTSLRDEGTNIRDDVSTLRCLGDKTSLLRQENQQLRTDLNSLQADIKKLQGGQNTLKAAQDKLQTEQNTLKAGQDKLKTEQSTLKAAQGKLQTQQNTLKAGQDKLQTEQSTLKAGQDKLQTQQNTLKAGQDKLQTEQNTLKAGQDKLQTEQNTLKAGQDKLQTQQSTLKACQDKLQTEQNTLKAGQDKLQTQQSTLKAGQDKLKTEQNTLKAGQDKLQTEQNTLRAGQDKLQTQQNTLKAGQDKLQTEQNTLRAGQDKLQTEQNTLRAGQDKLQNTLKTAQEKLQTEQNTLKAAHDQFWTSQNKLQADVGTVRSDVGNLKQNIAKLRTDMTSSEVTLTKARMSVSFLENEISKASAQVTFHTVLSSKKTTEQPETLICDYIVSNVGGGYNTETGVFTAPVSGCYCFMVTSCPYDTDLSIKGCLEIMLDDKRVGYLCATGEGMCASHTAVPVHAGQEVWLRTFGGSVFYGGCCTTFTGVLLQTDL
ncbi:flagellar attachment zone protein 1-like [Littorina saxatilis]|uniref:flagellar attachment zone protein 1-like n=1 Tax=Littorina saxatilis TaxID=31220 RepID=UPI0038B5D160